MTPPYRICLLDTKSRNPNHYICRSVFRALQALPEVESVVLASYGNAVELSRKRRCNVFFAFDGEDMHLDICARVMRTCDVSILWITEDPYEVDVNIRNAELFDLVFTNDAGCVARYGRMARHLPFAASTHLHDYPVILNDSDLRYDIFFAGTAWPNRTRILSSLVRDLPDKKLKIALPHNPYIPEPELPIPKSSYQWRTPATEFARLANASRITLALPRIFSGSVHGVASGSTPPPRVFEAAMAGTAQLADGNFPEIRNYFKPETEIVIYNSYAECLDRIRRLLSRPDERRQLAQASQARAIKEHTYEDRMRLVLAALADVTGRPARSPSAPKQKLRLLFVTHNVIMSPPFGGVEVYLDLVTKHLRSAYDVFFFTPRNHGRTSEYDVLDSGYHLLERFKFEGEQNILTLSDSVRENQFAGILNRFDVNLVHFHHLLRHLPSYLHITKAFDIPSVVTVQDYWVMCDSFNLLNFRSQFCNIPEHTDGACEVCVQQRRGETGGLWVRREFFRRALNACDKIIVNSPGALPILSRFYPEVTESDRVKIIPLPLPDSLPSSRIRTSQSHQNSPGLIQSINGAREPDRPLRVAVLGNFTKQKGADVMLWAAQALKNEPVEFTVFGRLDAPYDSMISILKLKNVLVHGSYVAAELPRLLQGFDVSLHLSIWPETYCITLSESWQNGLVPIVADIGALADRVQNGINGFKIPIESPGELTDLLRKLNLDRSQISKIRERITSALVCTERQHADRLIELYGDLLKGKEGSRKLPANVLAAESRVALFTTGTTAAKRDARNFPEAVGGSMLISRTIDVSRLAQTETNTDSRPGEPLLRLPESTKQQLRPGNCPSYLDYADGKTVPKKQWSTSAIAGSSLHLVGWTFDLNRKIAHSEIDVLFLPVNANGWYGRAVRTPRPDVDRAYSNAIAGDCGFDIVFSTAGMESLPYQLRLAQKTDEGFVLAVPGDPFQDITLRIFEPLLSSLPAATTSLTAGDPKRASLEAAGHISFLQREKSEVVAIQPAPGLLMDVAGWVFVEPASAVKDSSIFIRLTSTADGGVVFSKAERLQRPDIAKALRREEAVNSGFFAVVDCRGLPASDLAIDILVVTQGSVFEYVTGRRIRVLPGTDSQQK